MRIRTLAAVLAVLILPTACGGEEPQTPPPPAIPAPDATPEAPGATPDATDPTDGATSGEVLLGAVGEPDDPDAFTITLTDSSGQAVDSLPPGDYTIQVTDLSEIHNFHLTGPGVEETTTVPETGEATWNVTFEAGTYTFVCDPHSSTMIGEITVA